MITEKDFIDKMVEIAKDGYEYMDQLQCIFFTWNEFFNTDNDIAVAFTLPLKFTPRLTQMKNL